MEDNNLDELIYPADKEIEFDDFGFFTLNVLEASSIICRALWENCDIDREGEPDDLHFFDPRLDKFLEKHIEKWQDKLLTAIKNEKIKTKYISLDFNENIDPIATEIEFEELCRWGEERGVCFVGDFFNDYNFFEINLIDKAAEVVKHERLKMRNPSLFKEFIEESKKDDYWFNRCVESERELNKLRRQSKNQGEATVQPLHTKEKESLLKLFIGIASSCYGVDSIKSNQTKASEISSDILTDTGIEINDDTVRKYLKEAKKLLPVLEGD